MKVLHLVVLAGAVTLLSPACGDGDDVHGGTASGDGTNGTGKPGSGGAGGAAGPNFGFAGKPGITGTGGAGAGPSATGKNCGLTSIPLVRLPAEMLLVLDRSGSMIEPLARGMPEQRWTAVVGALNQTIMQTQPGVLWGLKLFPNDAMCGVLDGATVAAALNNHGPIMAAINANPARMNGGATPTQDAVRKGTRYLQTRMTPNPKYLLVATDGLPNCMGGRSNANDPAGAIAAVADAAAAGFPSFVVGIATAGSNAHQTLNEMAMKGGRPRAADPFYYSVQSNAELASTLAMITGQIASCVFTLQMDPPSPNNVAVDVDGMRVARDMTHTNGWDYSGTRAIQIFGPLCEKLKAGTAKGDVKIIFGCPGQVIP